MKRNHVMRPLKIVILVCILLQTVIFYSGCNNEANTDFNSDQIIRLEQRNLAEVKDKFCYLTRGELQKFDKDSIKEILNNQNILLVAGLMSEDDLIEVSSQVGGSFDREELADLQVPKGLVIYQDEKGKIRTAAVIGHCLLPNVEKDHEGGIIDDKGQDVFISDSKAGETDDAWEDRELYLEALYQVVQDLKKNESQGGQSRIFVYFGYDGDRTDQLGVSLITTSAERLKMQNGCQYDKVNSYIKVYADRDSQLKDFTLKHGIPSDDSAVILESRILSKVHNAQILSRTGFTYSDNWSVEAIEENHVDMNVESVLKYKAGSGGSGFRCGISYLTIRYGALDYKSPTDQTVGLKK